MSWRERFPSSGNNEVFCVATGFPCDRTECVKENGNSCRLAFQILVGKAADQKYTPGRLQLEIVKISDELDIDLVALKKRVKEASGNNRI